MLLSEVHEGKPIQSQISSIDKTDIFNSAGMIESSEILAIVVVDDNYEVEVFRSAWEDDYM